MRRRPERRQDAGPERVLLRRLQLAHCIENFPMLRKAAGLLLTVDQLAIDFDVENAATALDHFDRNAELTLDRVRQTGGLGRVVSLYAILDGNVHCSSFC